MSDTYELRRSLHAPDQRHAGKAAESEFGTSNVNKLMDLDGSAEEIVSVSLGDIPGIVRTPGYARALLQDAFPGLERRHLDSRVTTQAARPVAVKQRLLRQAGRDRMMDQGTLPSAVMVPGRERHLQRITIVTSEAAIWDLISGAEEAHVEQLKALAALARFQRVEVYLWPRHTVPPAGTHHMLLYWLRERYTPDPPTRETAGELLGVGYMETAASPWYTYRQQDVIRMQEATYHLVRRAMSLERSLELIEERIAAWIRYRGALRRHG